VNLELPFIDRDKECAQLQRLHTSHKHVLILGAEGVGKSALVGYLRESFGLRVCPSSARLAEICDSLECELELESAQLHLVQRKNRLLKSFAGTKQTVVFDGVAWTTPKVSSFLEDVSEREPVWLCARSDQAGDIGHFWQFLWKFERVELRPFHLAETRALLEAAVAAGQIPAAALDAVERLQQLSVGNPRVLGELITGLASGHYDPHKKFDLRLLDLDRRIQHLPTPVGLHLP